MKILVTGCAGFIGSMLCERLVREGYEVAGIDNFNDYYDPKLKRQNVSSLVSSNRFNLYAEDILNIKRVSEIFTKENPQKIVHLAARVGVRPSIANPYSYGEVNIIGTVNLLKIASKNRVHQFIFASSSSVYGDSYIIPFREDDPCRKIISPYGASKRAAEHFVESFYRSYGLKSVMLRFFTVYGPKGRPDMAPAIFTKAILNGQEITQYGDGSSSRDYTYIDDIVEGILRVIDNNFDCETINLGNNAPINLKDFIKTIEVVTGKEARVRKVPKQSGEVSRTWANIDKAKKLLGWTPKTGIRIGIKNYLSWLMEQNQ